MFTLGGGRGGGLWVDYHDRRLALYRRDDVDWSRK
jgi:hypothetical protein